MACRHLGDPPPPDYLCAPLMRYGEVMVRAKQNGGRTIVQEPSTAEAPEMPRAAIAAGAADQVLSLQGIAEYICREAPDW
ncbi:MAG: hypothetical protein L6300_03950 [Syntrophaceae bacterium]|nr:hypothetical protein [Syntrophaceae bacterium]